MYRNNRYSLVLVPCQIANVLLRRLIGIRILDTHGAHGGMRDLRGGHSKLHECVRRQFAWDLVIRSKSHTADQLMRGISA